MVGTRTRACRSRHPRNRFRSPQIQDHLAGVHRGHAAHRPAERRWAAARARAVAARTGGDAASAGRRLACAFPRVVAVADVFAARQARDRTLAAEKTGEIARPITPISNRPRTINHREEFLALFGCTLTLRCVASL